MVKMRDRRLHRMAQAVRPQRQTVRFDTLQQSLTRMLERLASGWEAVAELTVLKDSKQVLVSFLDSRRQISGRIPRWMRRLRSKVRDAVAEFKRSVVMAECSVGIA